MGGYLTPKLGGRCIDFIKFLLVNGSINTVTDFALLLLVSDVSLGGCRVILMRMKALAYPLETESKYAAEMHPDWYFHNRINVSSIMYPSI